MSQQLDLTQDLEHALWADACFAAEVFALLVRAGKFEKAGLRVKAHAGPVREVWMQHLKSLLPDSTSLQQVPINISVERLLGGLDLGLTLSEGRAVEMRGVLSKADQNVLFLPMAGLTDPAIVPLIAASMDSGEVRVERDGLSTVRPARFAVLCFDESDDDDAVSGDLVDRLMLHVDLRCVSVRAAQAPSLAPALREGTKPAPNVPDDVRSQLCALPQAFGLSSMRPALQMNDLARALCQLSGDTQVSEEHVSAAIRLGLVHRANQLPAAPQEPEEEQSEPEPQPPEDPSNSEPPPENTAEPSGDTKMPDDMAIETMQASLPHGLLAYLKAGRAALSKQSSAGRRGVRKTGGSRGRPLASRKGALAAGKRLDLIGTLRAAAPFQKARAQKAVEQNRPSNVKVHVRPADFHIRRYQESSETTTIFVVDASGSTAFNRLREAKGAVELLLGESYARRDYVALISFRGRDAQVLLPPTRALVRAKRSLASLPGGGGSPLASGILAAHSLALEERKKGRDPSIVVMTDGSANVDVQGAGGRKQAAEDADKFARLIAFSGIPAILVDIGRQPQRRARQLAEIMDATYLPMPFAGSKDLTAAISASR